jgi:hypothetical protein
MDSIPRLTAGVYFRVQHEWFVFHFIPNNIKMLQIHIKIMTFINFVNYHYIKVFFFLHM